MKTETNETPLQDLKNQALKDYEDAVKVAHHYNSFIVKCIEAYNPIQNEVLTDEEIEKQFPNDPAIVAERLRIPKDLFSSELFQVLEKFVIANENQRMGAKYARDKMLVASQSGKDKEIIEKQRELIEIYRSYYSCLQKIDKNKVTQLESELLALQSVTPDKAEATKCKHENWVWVQKLKQCSDCGYTWFDKAEGETPSECKECRHQNSENCNTCDILNPQFR